MTATAIIPARGGSKRIPRKNLQKVGGKSLVRRAIETCQDAGLAVVVSTDCPDIAREAVTAGAVALRRPDDLATDDALTIDVMRHAVGELMVSGGVYLVQCTAPLLTVGHLERLRANGSGVLAHCMPGVQVDRNRGRGWILAGSAWYWPSVEAFELMGLRYAPLVVIPGPHLDIDEPHDLDVARLLIERGTACRDRHQWLAAAEALGGGGSATAVLGPIPNASTTNGEERPISAGTRASGDARGCAT